MILPQIEVSIVENVINESISDPISYGKEKMEILQAENKILYVAINKMVTDMFKDSYSRGCAMFLVLSTLNIVNTQMEVNELREMFSE